MKQIIHVFFITFATFSTLVNCSKEDLAENVLALRGGFIIDTSDLGRSTNDIENSVIIIRDGMIESVASVEEIVIPQEAEVIDITGKYIIPGMIEGFGAHNNQAYANAYLYSGVTSVITVSGGRRGDLFEEADPTPNIFKLEAVADVHGSKEEYFAVVDSLAEDGYDVLLIMYEARKEQLKPIVNRAQQHGMVTIGELGHASYQDGIQAGIDAFVHTTRYSLNAAPENMQANVADEPFGDALNCPKWQYYKWLTSMPVDLPGFKDQTSLLASEDIALIPTLSLLYLDQEWSRNPWDETVSEILDPLDINAPADRETGKHTHYTQYKIAYEALAKKVMQIEQEYRKAGARYLAGSGTDVWGTMPGISLHTELEGLSRIGMTNREAIAAATGNYNEVFGWNIGRIAAGFKADILVLELSPLDDLKHLKDISMLIKDGKIIDRGQLLITF
ncbi:amidohydrolase family protein [candidate division KSB1 bacterium]